MNKTHKLGSDRPIEERAAFDAIRYGSVWEDADVLCEALAPVAKDGRLLTIASSGDNALALLTLDPAEVVAVDLSPVQLACVMIRVAAFTELDDDALLAFLGVTPSTNRVETYRSLRTAMPVEACIFWDARLDLVQEGVIHAGKFEAYFSMFRRRLLPLIHPKRRVEDLLQSRSPEERRRFYGEVWDTWRWRLLFRLFFSRAVCGRLGRDPAFFEHVDGPIATRMLARTQYAFSELPTDTNPYLAYVLTGNYRSSALPRYLRPEFRGIVRERISRIRTVLGPAEKAVGPFDGFNLSDIFEYMSPAEHERVYTALLDSAAPGARLAYWNLFVPRTAPHALRKRVVPLSELSETLHSQDLAWFYQSFHVDEVSHVE
jgi:S-adenosylmethionine-diacylglycerol 3-amino-3-carboxypropyl transferase